MLVCAVATEFVNARAESNSVASARDFSVEILKRVTPLDFVLHSMIHGARVHALHDRETTENFSCGSARPSPLDPESRARKGACCQRQKVGRGSGPKNIRKSLSLLITRTSSRVHGAQDARQ
jgi:hypothetical protein